MYVNCIRAKHVDFLIESSSSGKIKYSIELMSSVQAPSTRAELGLDSVSTRLDLTTPPGTDWSKKRAARRVLRILEGPYYKR